MKKIIKCNKSCNECNYLNTKVDNKGYPWGYDCMKYNDSIFEEDFKNTKEFEILEEESEG